MSENSKKPRIRFSGFLDNWEQKKLSELATFSKGHGYSKGDLRESGTPIILYGRLYTKYETVISDVDTFVEAKERSVYSRGNEVIVPASGETAEDISRAAVVENAGILLGGDLNVLAPKPSIDSVFLALIISNGEQQKELSKRAQGKSVVHIHNSDLQEVNLSCPKLDEQRRIGSLFSNFDRLITLHQREYDKTVNIKKAMLEKMFPKTGADRPEIRFAGFTGAWEQWKLGDVADIVGGGTPSTSISEYWGGDIDWYAPAEIGEQTYVSGSQKRITEFGLQNSSAKILPIGTVLFTSRAGIGSTAILAKSGCTNQGFQSIVPHKDEIDSYFIFSRTHELKHYGETIGAGSTFVEVSGKQMAQMPILIPVLEEQRRIGSFFAVLDCLITLHQRKLQKLKNLKKAFLEKMFVSI